MPNYCHAYLVRLADLVGRPALRPRIREWVRGGARVEALWGAGGPLEDFDRAGRELFERELAGLPPLVMPVIADSIVTAAACEKRITLESPPVPNPDEFREHRRVRLLVDYDEDAITVGLYHLGPPDQAEWYHRDPSTQAKDGYCLALRAGSDGGPCSWRDRARDLVVAGVIGAAGGAAVALGLTTAVSG